MLLGDPVVCLSYFKAKPEHKDALIRELLKLIEPTRREPGCLVYELLIDEEDPNFLIMSEKFVNQEALDVHQKNSYIVQFVEGPMLQWCEKVTWNVGREIKKVIIK